MKCANFLGPPGILLGSIDNQCIFHRWHGTLISQNYTMHGLYAVLNISKIWEPAHVISCLSQLTKIFFLLGNVHFSESTLIFANDSITMVVVRFGVVTRLLRQRYGTNSLNIHEVCEDRFDVGSISGAMAPEKEDIAVLSDQGRLIKRSSPRKGRRSKWYMSAKSNFFRARTYLKISAWIN